MLIYFLINLHFTLTVNQEQEKVRGQAAHLTDYWILVNIEIRKLKFHWNEGSIIRFMLRRPRWIVLTGKVALNDSDQVLQLILFA
jgi:hypothetical protein